jgi:CRISPR-associated protein (TIGR02584 family)
MKTTLVAVSGISPAILTETIWALAGEPEPVIPDDVVVITTTKGESDLRGALLENLPEWGGGTVWEALRADVFARAGLATRSKKLQLSTRVIELPDEATGVKRKADDLRSGADNEAAADFILHTLAPYADAEDSRVIASIAGGRKTMGALLYAAMSLVGKESDRVTHVLVSEPFESCRGFFYPGQPVQDLEARPFGQAPGKVRAADAVIDLADIAFVPLRNGFAEMNEGKRSFTGLVSRYSRELHRPKTGRPRVAIDPEKGLLYVDEKKIRVSGRGLLVAVYLIERARKGEKPHENASEAEKHYRALYDDWKRRRRCSRFLDRYYDGQPADAGDFPKALSELRKKLEKAGAADCIPFLAPERSRIGFDAEIVDPPT